MWELLIAGTGWVIIAFIIGFMLGVFVGYKVAIGRSPEIDYLRKRLNIERRENKL
jgi:hypothetical protein